MSLRPVLTVAAAVGLGAATLISATPAVAAPTTYTNGGVQITLCKEITNARKGVATISIDSLNTNVATTTDDGLRNVGATVSRPKGSGAARIVARWDAVLTPGQSAGGSLKAQTGDRFSIGVGTADGQGAGETLDLADVPTC